MRDGTETGTEFPLCMMVPKLGTEPSDLADGIKSRTRLSFVDDGIKSMALVA
jgi:hypothetical protein